jgi:hypothetical protein
MSTNPNHHEPNRARNLPAKKRLKLLVRSVWKYFDYFLMLTAREYKYGRKADLRLFQRLTCWNHGFLSESATLYQNNGSISFGHYLSDFACYTKTGDIDQPFGEIMRNKLCFWGFMKNFSERVSPVLGLIRRGKLVHLGTPDAELPSTGLPRLRAKLILKPLSGSHGDGVITYEWRDGGHLVNSEPVAEGELLRHLGEEIYLVFPFVRQAEYASRIFPDVANTVRILTMYDDREEKAFVAAAVHRFGVRGRGVVVDNWRQGGISADVDPATGRLSRGYGFPFGGRLTVYPHHPDTGMAIEGEEIPNWSRIRDEVLDLANKLLFLPYIGWDIIITDESYVIIEGNCRPNVNVMQVHRPLLADERVRRFYERHGIL